MDAQEKYRYWLDIAEYDLATAQAMFDSGRWVYVVFMCQQAVEKLIKGLYVVYLDDNVPRIHNISKLIDSFAEKLPAKPSDAQYRLFDYLTSCYIQGRYTEYKQKISVLVDKRTAANVLTQTKEVFSWLQHLRP
jgi:HEPN domain-containing protein